MSDGNWLIKRTEITAEHKLERAPNDLKAVWKTWLKENGPGQAKGVVALPVSGPVSMVRPWRGGTAAARTRPRPATCELEKEIKPSIHNKLHVNAHSAASQKTAEKLMNQYTEYERNMQNMQ